LLWLTASSRCHPACPILLHQAGDESRYAVFGERQQIALGAQRVADPAVADRKLALPSRVARVLSTRRPMIRDRRFLRGGGKVALVAQRVADLLD